MFYKPTAPYYFKSGKRKGESVEKLMFSNYDLLVWIKKKMDKENTQNYNGLHKHLEWLLARGEKLKTERLCPYCNRNHVKFFLVIQDESGISIATTHTCCDNLTCKKKLMANHGASLFPIRFSSILLFRNKTDRKQVIKLIKKTCGLGNLTPQKAFNFFKACE